MRYNINSTENNCGKKKIIPQRPVYNCGSLCQTSLLNSSPMQGKSPPSQNIQMKWASRLTQLAMFSNLRNDCRRCKEEGQYRRGAGWQGKPSEVGGMSLALYNRGTCRCRCSSSKSFYQPSGREVTRNSFGITHLHHAFLRRNVSVQDWWSVGKRLAARARRADVGETWVRGDPPLREGM